MSFTRKAYTRNAPFTSVYAQEKREISLSNNRLVKDLTNCNVISIIAENNGGSDSALHNTCIQASMGGWVLRNINIDSKYRFYETIQVIIMGYNVQEIDTSDFNCDDNSEIETSQCPQSNSAIREIRL